MKQCRVAPDFDTYVLLAYDSLHGAQRTRTVEHAGGRYGAATR